MKTERSISALSQTSYNGLHMYETDSVLLSDNISKKAEEFLLRKNGKWPQLDEIMPDLKKLQEKNPRFAHYIALKMGATKDELDELYSDER